MNYKIRYTFVATFATLSDESADSTLASLDTPICRHLSQAGSSKDWTEGAGEEYFVVLLEYWYMMTL